jgi:hypothetical protein
MKELSTKGLFWIKGITNVCIAYTLVILGLTLYGRFEAWQLGAACPIPMQRPYTYSAMVAIVLAFLLILVVEFQEKKFKKIN